MSLERGEDKGGGGVWARKLVLEMQEFGFDDEKGLKVKLPSREEVVVFPMYSRWEEVPDFRWDPFGIMNKGLDEWGFYWFQVGSGNKMWSSILYTDLKTMGEIKGKFPEMRVMPKALKSELERVLTDFGRDGGKIGA